jgi:hypothetical protein
MLTAIAAANTIAATAAAVLQQQGTLVSNFIRVYVDIMPDLTLSMFGFDGELKAVPADKVPEAMQVCQCT